MSGNAAVDGSHSQRRTVSGFFIGYLEAENRGLYASHDRTYDWRVSRDRDADVERIFAHLSELDPDRREEQLSLVTGDPELAAEVASLLRASDSAGDFLGLLARSDAPAPLREPGEIIASRYRIERSVGSGAMGHVYLARDQELQRLVALKFVQAADGSPVADQAQLVAEARSAARLSHRNVATIHDIARTDDGELFIAMAFYSGETLRDRISRGPIDEQEALQIAAQIVSALAAAHAAGIVHRDVKPANVLFDDDGTIKLTDFGIAELVTESGNSRVRRAAGTAAYMSPEQARGEPVDGRTDLWAAGIVLYEMLTGTRPRLDVMSDESGLQLPDDGAAYAPATRAAISSLLQVDINARPTDAAEVARTLSRAAAELASRLDSAAPTHRASRLPEPLTSFIGRTQTILDARELLGANRLVTLTGPGGTGKTRLALHLALLLQDEFDDGAMLVPLAEISTPDLVPSLIAQSLGIRDLGGQSLDDRVAEALRDRQLLLVLDNFEHVLDAARFVGRLLAVAPRVTVLATSRAPLGVQGEQELPVPPLQIPMSRDQSAEESEAVQLFVQRARAVRHDFAISDETRETVAEICRRLDGLPLALELAAARAKLLSPRAMLSRLEHRFELLRGGTADRPARHVTMRDVIDWSYVLLTETERALFEWLSVFAGGISLEAAESMTTAQHVAGTSAFDVLDVLGSLCNKSLLRQEEQPDGEPRFMMLETMREFALDRLRANGDELRARRAQRAYCLSFVEHAETELRGPAQAVWFDRLEREYANCRLALDSALTDGAAGCVEAARIAVALHRLWFTRGPLPEGVSYLRRIIAATDASSVTPDAPAPDSTLRARLFSAAAQLANTRGVFPDARDLFQRALSLYRDAGNDAGVAASLNSLAWTVWIIGDLAQGTALSESAMEMHHASGNTLGVTLSLSNLAWIAMEQGDYVTAERHFETVIESHRSRGDQRATAFALSWLGALVARRGELVRALQLHELAMQMLEPVADSGFRMLCRVRMIEARHSMCEPGDHATEIENGCLPSLRAEGGRLWPLAFAITTLGVILRDVGELGRARSTLLHALEIRRQTGALQGVAEARVALGTVHHLEGNRAMAGDCLAQALRDARTFGGVPIQVECIEAIASVLASDGRAQLAARLLGVAEATRATLGAPRAPRYQLQFESLVERITRVIGQPKLLAEFDAARAVLLADACDHAISSVRQ